MRCAFCPAPAECNLGATNVPPPCCWAHRTLAQAIYREVAALAADVDDRRPVRVDWDGPWHRWVWSLRDAVIARDAAEQRGEPPGAAGWTIFG